MTALNLASRIELWPVDRLKPYARNARTHDKAQVTKIAASMTEFGFTNPILVDSADGIIAGHGRLMAAQELGLPEVPVIVLDHLSDAQRRAYILADNRLALDAGWDEDMLALELTDLQEQGFDLALTGFSDNEIEGLLAEDVEQTDAQSDPDEVPEVEDDPVSRIGDVWLLGTHRVMCGSSTDLDQLETLMLGKRADMLFTDPPYLMNFTGAVDGQGNTNKRHAPIMNDNLSKEDGEIFLRDVATSIRMYCNGAWYVCFYRLGIDNMMNALTAVGLKWRNLIIWKKNHLNLSNSDYKSIYEPIIFGWQADYEPILYGWNHSHVFKGAKGAVDVLEIAVPSVWEIEKTRKNDLHPTMKPVALCEAAILNSSNERQIVLDLFGGPGSTLIAAEKLRRHARLMELEPKYVDVIVRRWQDFTGRIASLEETGQTFNSVAEERFSAIGSDVAGGGG
jgi:DNA modification methylase